MSKISLINAAINKATSSRQYATEVNKIWFIGIELLYDIINNKNIPKWRKEEQINLITIGALTVGLACAQSDAHDTVWEFNSGKNSYYPLTWEALQKACDITAFLRKNGYHNQHSEIFQTLSKNNPLYFHMIEITGQKIIEGKLPFDASNLKSLFPDLATQIDDIEKQIQQQPHCLAIQNAFDATINSMTEMRDVNARQQELFTQLITLKNNTLLSFIKQETNFDVDGCLSIAKHIETLVNKMLEDTLTSEDLHHFNQSTQVFQTSKWFATLVAAIIGITAGMVIGFAAGGLLPSTIVSGIAAVSCTLWYTRKNDPLLQISSLAKDSVQEQDPAVATLRL